MRELPYFKFYTNEWITGDITFLDYETQGLFINLCAYYWSKDGNLTLTNAKRKFRDVKEESFDLLIESDIIKINDDVIIIKFLEEQREERGKLSSRNALNGAKGGRPKNPKETQKKPTALFSETQTEAKKSNIEEKRREENKKGDSNESLFDIFWGKYPKKVAKDKCKSKFLKLKQSDIDKIISTIDNFISYKPFETYTHPNPETYLNQKRWEDEVPTETKSIATQTTEDIYYDNVMRKIAEAEAVKKLNQEL